LTGDPWGKTVKDRLAIQLKEQIESMDVLRKLSPASPEFMTWRKETEELLRGLWGDDSPEVRDFGEIYYTPIFLSCRMDDAVFEDAFRKGIEEAGDLLIRLLATCGKWHGG
jgi:hypothetical protein